MDKTLLTFLKNDGLLVAGTILIGFGMQLFGAGEYIFSLAYIIAGSGVIFLRTLEKTKYEEKKVSSKKK